MGELEQARDWHRRGDLDRAVAAYRSALQAAQHDPIAWHDYLLLLAPAVLLRVGHGVPYCFEAALTSAEVTAPSSTPHLLRIFV